MKPFKRKLVGLFLKGYVYLTNRPKPETEGLDSIMPRSVVVFSTTALGDFLMNTPAIYSLKKRFPDASFTLVSSGKNMSLVNKYDWFDNIIEWDNKIKHVLPLIREMRRLKPDLCVILHSHYPYDVLAALVSGCKIILRDNYRYDPVDLNQYLHACSGEFTGHTIARKLELIRVLGADSTLSTMHLPKTYTKPAAEPRPLRVGFQLGASRDERRWPVACFNQLAVALFEYYPDIEIVITGAKSEQNLEAEFYNAVPPDMRSCIRRYAGKTQLDDLTTLIMSLDVLVTGDTGPMHIAVAARVKTVSLFGTANPLYSGPFQDPDLHRIIHQPPESNDEHPMQRIRPEMVFEAVRASLENA
ncbi:MULTISPECIES: glycosyltransferase family 9 protein [Pantoea]|jgi:ADP-heptose:LPS heptosyltransferase|uniref:glycosyltransferase family 9 protein n=1 Tax=Pantoea TaxID=53335 RepID=UPI000EA1EBE6|nr:MULTISPECIES: glycosyltransferase family 9 protein [Pantoea]MBZ6384344.1 glycosyltransferase family 9 protein [Pantoea piersonii]MBZ6399903.1 glycosyltransferase family 9 protein [Pantoea piersonii]MBZ6406395.1 glycosyltransferase family 9 protein [Pantoea piersonii]MBZ6425141.1 glycosyltransferase family 9 protein [Pantoea piersonii]NYB02688.1 glycosyltransferase family 9 protein [Pantoea piersonii]